MKLCIIGTGYVGLVTGTIFAEKGHSVCCVDMNEDKIAQLERGESPIYEPGLDELLQKNRERMTFTTDINQSIRDNEVIFICVGTPMSDTGHADLSQIENVARTIAHNLNGYKVIVEKSTVPVKTGEKVRMTIERVAPAGATFDVVSNPEFLREGSAIADALNPDRIVVGVPSPKAEECMRELYRDFSGELIATDINSAELIKHASNSFLALKISYINAVANVCELSGANVEEVARGMGLDSRIGEQFLKAGIGYGGSCFPKDVAAFERISEELGYFFPLLTEVQAINRRQKDLFLKRIEEALWILRGKTIGILGLAFKPNTDDMREAPSLTIVQGLLDKGAKILAHDPVSMDNARQFFEGDITYVEDPYDVCQGAHALVLITDWSDYKELDMAKVGGMMMEKVFLDGRNVFDPAQMRELGFDYRSVGRS